MHLIRAAVAACLLLGLNAPAGQAAPLTWSAPDPVDRFQPFGSGAPGRAVSCVGDTLCVALDNSRQALSSTRPSDPAVPWSIPRFVDASNDISCATTLCVAVGGAIMATTNPVAGEPTWTTVRLAPDPPLSGERQRKSDVVAAPVFLGMDDPATRSPPSPPEGTSHRRSRATPQNAT